MRAELSQCAVILAADCTKRHEFPPSVLPSDVTSQVTSIDHQHKTVQFHESPAAALSGMYHFRLRMTIKRPVTKGGRTWEGGGYLAPPCPEGSRRGLRS